MVYLMGLMGFLMVYLIVSRFALCCVGFGLITATITRTPRAATGVSFIFIIPQMIVGIFVSAVAPSASTANHGRFIPSYDVTDALTTLYLRGAAWSSAPMFIVLTVIVATSVIVLLIAILLFRQFGSK